MFGTPVPVGAIDRVLSIVKECSCHLVPLGSAGPRGVRGPRWQFGAVSDPSYPSRPLRQSRLREVPAGKILARRIWRGNLVYAEACRSVRALLRGVGNFRIGWPEDRRRAPRPLRRWTSDALEPGRSSFIARATSGSDVASPRIR